MDSFRIFIAVLWATHVDVYKHKIVLCIKHYNGLPKSIAAKNLF